MGNQRISVDPDQVRQAADAFAKAGDESETQVRTVSQAVDNLRNEWEGATQSAFYTQYEDWAKNMTGYVELLRGIGSNLKAIADTFEQADKEVAAKLNQ
jgi:WXG100 family type VII secretion target